MKPVLTKIYNRGASLVAAAAALGILSCTHAPTQLSGGGSDTEVSGRVLAIDGTARAGVAVSLIASGYDPAFDGILPKKMTVATDSAGNFRFDSLTRGIYNLQALRTDDGTKILVNSIAVDSGKTTMIADAALKKTATLVIALPDSLASMAGFVTIPGTLLSHAYSGNKSLVHLDSIPQGTLVAVQFKKYRTDSLILYRNVVVASTDTVILSPWHAWSHSAKIVLNTTTTGAGVTEMAVNFPVLIRLTNAGFNFSQAKPNGEDIRFVKQDFSLLPFEIEDWDSATGTASMWVKVDTVHGNDADQFFFMLWGNSAAKASSNSAAVFDTANGFQGVWHLQQSGGTTQKDATVNHFDGTPVAMSGSSDVIGLIGRAQDFDGSSQCITVLNARNSRLDVQADSFFAVSAWVYARTLNSGLQVLLSKGSAQFGLMVNKQNQWEFYGGLAGYGVDTTTTAAADTWTYLMGVRRGLKQYLFVNGELADSAAVAAAGSAALSKNVYDMVIGRQSDNQSLWFDGIVDEAIVANKARTAAWIRLCYQNQRADQTLVRILNAQ